ncbi:MAG: methyltransferase domain-containing protein [Campylobacterales bacterium]|nr:methyltransferase domain-containing protein [Campylobacterales bacterium]
MKISREFSKYAGDYESRNSIQNLVVEKLLSLVKNQPKKFLDLGCGSGALYKQIEWEYEKVIGVDFAHGMLALHPKDDKVSLMFGDFNEDELFARLAIEHYDYILSASALQWATDLDRTFKNIAKLNAPVSFAIFTANTFKTLNKTAGIDSMLLSVKELESLQKKHFNANFELIEYRLEFESVRDMLRYIKKSGVSGSRNLLSVKELKALMQNYPLNYLEFEVAFISS